MQWWGSRTKVRGQVGLSIGEHIVLAHVVPNNSDIQLTYCVHTGRAHDGVSAAPDKQTQLARLVADAGLKGVSANLVLAASDYNLFLVDAPPVAAEEMASAVRWKIKDLLDYPVEQAVIDVFTLPPDATPNRPTGRVYAVAAAKSRLQQLITLVNQSGLELRAIDIPELALRNITSHLEDDYNGLAFLSLEPGGGVLNIVKQGQLYLTRRINLPVSQNMTADADWGGQQDRLVLEIQRSLDYFESQMGQQPVSRIVLAPRGRDTSVLLDVLTSSLAPPVVALNLDERISAPDWADEALKADCLTVIGGGLRPGSGVN